MKAGRASATAQRVAAHRLTFERAPASYGDSAADEILGRDVAGSVAGGSSGSMVTYLKARTSFFDRVVVGALDSGIQQVVIAAAGYDGRALRYAKPGVRWFEVDHPDTQRDKRERLDRLHIDSGHITFVPADFTRDSVAAELLAAGHDRNVQSLLLCEGVVVYLEPPVFTALLHELRAAAAPGSRLAISVSTTSSSVRQTVRRTIFQAAVASMGEPARSRITADDAEGIFAETGWRVAPSTQSAEQQERTRSAGFVVVEPVP
jgi:methyltransferase (TIGR00027 family)